MTPTTKETPLPFSLPVAITVADPVLATIDNVCAAIAGLCAFASTPAGQKIVEIAISDTDALSAGLAKIGNLFSGIHWPWSAKPAVKPA